LVLVWCVDGFFMVGVAGRGWAVSGGGLACQEYGYVEFGDLLTGGGFPVGLFRVA
jgi:hypothetical protein